MRTKLTDLSWLAALLLTMSSTGLAGTAAAPSDGTTASTSAQSDWRLQGNQGLGRTRGQPNDDQVDEDEDDQGGTDDGSKRRQDQRDD